jgi:hypothetical protein
MGTHAKIDLELSRRTDLCRGMARQRRGTLLGQQRKEDMSSMAPREGIRDPWTSHCERIVPP